MKKDNIAILGAGAFGTALGGILASNGYDIDYYDSKTNPESLEAVLSQAFLVILCVPSKSAPGLLPHLPKNLPLIIATKGFLGDYAFRDFKDYMVISGPGFADDIKAHRFTKLTATDQRIVDLFQTDYLAFDRTTDKNGVLLCGALKNVYAIQAGLLNLEPGNAMHARFLKEALSEMKQILAENGADPKTADLVCGQGDLKLTCYYPSRNYEFGRKLRENPNHQPDKTVEGISALKRIKRSEIKIPKNLPYLETLIQESKSWA